MKHIPSTSAANLNDYLGREKDGNGLPRVLYEWGQHCRPETAKDEFRALRVEHGRQGELRTIPATYARPDEPSDATHLKVGKNWRKPNPKRGETATHRRIEPQVPLEKRPEAIHYIVSFGLDEVSLEDPEQTKRAFESVVAMWEHDYPGVQAKLVAHGDARGSEVAQERGENGKFHVHVMANAVMHTQMQVDDRNFRPGMRVSGPLTHVDRMRERHDAFLEERGHEFGLGPQRLPAPRSAEARAVRRTDLDFWERERGIERGDGKVSHQDLAREAVETALGSLAQGNLAGLDVNQRKHRLADEAKAASGVELKLRITATGDVKLRSYVVPGRKQAIGGTRLGERYTDAGLEEQLELVAHGRWKPHQRPKAGPAKRIPELTDTEVAELQEQVNELALDEQRDAKLDRWLEDWASEANTSVDELWTSRGLSGTPEDREIAHLWKSEWEAKVAQKAEAAHRAQEAQRAEEARQAQQARQAKESLKARASDVAQDQPEPAKKAGAPLDMKGVPSKPRRERPAEESLKARASEVAQDQPEPAKKAGAPLDMKGVASKPRRERPAEESLRARASEVAQDQPEPAKKAGAPLDMKAVPSKPRRERQVRVLNANQKHDAELIAVVRRELFDGGAYIDFQLAASDPAARGQSGLHLHAKRQMQVRDGRKVERTETWQKLTVGQYEKVRAAAGGNRVVVGDKQVLALRGNVMPSMTSSYTVSTNSLQPSRRAPIGPDVIAKQRKSEDLARANEPQRHEALKKQMERDAADLRPSDEHLSASDQFA